MPRVNRLFLSSVDQAVFLAIVKRVMVCQGSITKDTANIYRWKHFGRNVGGTVSVSVPKSKEYWTRLA